MVVLKTPDSFFLKGPGLGNAMEEAISQKADWNVSFVICGFEFRPFLRSWIGKRRWF